MTTLVINIVARFIVERSNPGCAVTQTLEPPKTSVPPAEQPFDRPRRKRSVPQSTLIEMGGSAVAAVALVWLSFSVAGITGPLGFAVCVIIAFSTIYAIICWQRYGVLPMKDRLATLAIWTGALAALIPLVAVILYVIYKGLYVVLERFPHFFIADMSGSDRNVADHARWGRVRPSSGRSSRLVWPRSSRSPWGSSLPPTW